MLENKLTQIKNVKLSNSMMEWNTEVNYNQIIANKSTEQFGCSTTSKPCICIRKGHCFVGFCKNIGLLQSECWKDAQSLNHYTCCWTIRLHSFWRCRWTWSLSLRLWQSRLEKEDKDSYRRFLSAWSQYPSTVSSRDASSESKGKLDTFNDEIKDNLRNHPDLFSRFQQFLPAEWFEDSHKT